MTSSGSGLYRLSLTYRVGEDGLLLAQDLPAARVSVRGEGALHRRLAAHAEAHDAAFVALASRYGPLGPTARIAVADQPTYLWALDGSVRSSVRQLKLLRAWIAHGGSTPIPGHIAPVAHGLAAIAEADDGTIDRLIDLLSGDSAPSEAERASLDSRLDRVEHRFYAGLSKRAAVLNAQYASGAKHVRVAVKPNAARQLPAAARNWRVLIDKASEFGGAAGLITPGSLGRLATELRPYFGHRDLPLYPEESVAAWRGACQELAQWVATLSVPAAQLAEDRPTMSALLTLRLQQVDAWPFPRGDLLGTFPRALWSLWQPITDSRPPRNCAWYEGCTQLLPSTAHGNRRYCPYHVRLAARQRAARTRQRARCPVIPASGKQPISL